MTSEKIDLDFCKRLADMPAHRRESLKKTYTKELRKCGNNAVKPETRSRLESNLKYIEEYEKSPFKFIEKYAEKESPALREEVKKEDEGVFVDCDFSIQLDKMTPFEIDSYIVRKWRNLRSSAKRRNKEFNLTLDVVRKLVLQKRCYYTGAKFSKNPDSRNYKTIDRKDNRKGYVVGNVVAATRAANNLKEMVYESDNTLISITPKQIAMFANKMAKII